jgi:hypothetical protein
VQASQQKAALRLATCLLQTRCVRGCSHDSQAHWAMWTVLAPNSCKQPLSPTLSRHYNVVLLSPNSIVMLIQVSIIVNKRPKNESSRAEPDFLVTYQPLPFSVSVSELQQHVRAYLGMIWRSTIPKGSELLAFSLPRTTCFGQRQSLHLNSR